MLLPLVLLQPTVVQLNCPSVIFYVSLTRQRLSISPSDAMDCGCRRNKTRYTICNCLVGDESQPDKKCGQTRTPRNIIFCPQLQTRVEQIVDVCPKHRTHPFRSGDRRPRTCCRCGEHDQAYACRKCQHTRCGDCTIEDSSTAGPQPAPATPMLPEAHGALRVTRPAPTVTTGLFQLPNNLQGARQSQEASPGPACLEGAVRAPSPKPGSDSRTYTGLVLLPTPERHPAHRPHQRGLPTTPLSGADQALEESQGERSGSKSGAPVRRSQKKRSTSSTPSGPASGGPQRSTELDSSSEPPACGPGTGVKWGKRKYRVVEPIYL
jgi:hypothetical protein